MALYPVGAHSQTAFVPDDDRPIRQRWERQWVDLQRIEVLEIPGPGRRFALRVYTRRHFQVLIAETTLQDLDEVLPRSERLGHHA